MSMNDLAALEQSSNVYMFKIALSLGGLTYYPGMGLNLGNDTLQKMRNGYNQMGLGVGRASTCRERRRGLLLTQIILVISWIFQSVSLIRIRHYSLHSMYRQLPTAVTASSPAC